MYARVIGSMLACLCAVGQFGCSGQEPIIVTPPSKAREQGSIRPGYGVIRGMTYGLQTGSATGRYASPDRFDLGGRERHVVTVLSSEGKQVSARVNQEGRFRFEVLPGQYRVIGPADAYPPVVEDSKVDGRATVSKLVSVYRGRVVECDFRVGRRMVDGMSGGFEEEDLGEK